MNGATVRWLGAVPAAVYVTFELLRAGPPVTLLSIGLAAALAVPLASRVTSRLGNWWYVPAVVGLVTVVALAVASGGVTAPVVAPLIVGVLLGAPALLVALFGTLRRAPAAGPLGVLATLAVGALDLAVVRGVPVAGASARTWAAALGAIASNQGVALRAFATGAALPAAPLSYTGDAVFDALTLVAVFGLFLSWLDPLARSGGSRTLAPRSKDAQGPDVGGPTPGLARTGARSLVVTVAVVLAFESAAAVSPSNTLLGVAVAAPLVVGLVVGVTRRRPSPRPDPA